MFAATPRLRDRIDVRTMFLVGVIALGAFALQLAFLAHTVADPLGGAIADFDRAPQVEGVPDQAIAAEERPDDVPDLGAGARLVRERPGSLPVTAAAQRECLVYR